MSKFIRKIAKGDNPYDEVLSSASGFGGAGAGLASEIVTNALLGPGVGGLASDLGSIGGLIYPSDKVKDKTLRDFSALSFIPGMSRARGMLRSRKVDKDISSGKIDRSAIISEKLGALSLPLILGIAGYIADKKGLIGGEDDEFDGFRGAGYGLGAGALASTAAWLVGLAKKRRSRKEHKKYLEDDSVLKNMLIPGHAAHALGRRDKMKLATVMDWE